MRPASTPPQRRADARLLVLDSEAGRAADLGVASFPALLDPGDVVVVNDAATLPASLPARVVDGSGPAGQAVGSELEIRLAARGEHGWRAVLFGPGTWRDRTEDRPAPPVLAPGTQLAIGRVIATIVAVSPQSPRLVDLAFADLSEGRAVLAELYRVGRPVQYSHLRDDLELWSVQTAYAGRPWAVEMPSAGRPLDWSLLLALHARGVEVCSLTHAAGLSATGDPALDALLPLPERYDIPAQTLATIARARRRGRRVVAMGTTVVRALEGSAQEHGSPVAGPGETDLVLGPHTRVRVVDSIVTGMHDPSESHFRLLGAFASPELLERGWRHAIARDYRSHEFGDICLLGAGLAAARPEMPWASLLPETASPAPAAPGWVEAGCGVALSA